MLETVILVIIGVVCGTVLGFWLGRVSGKDYAQNAEKQQEECTSEGAQKEERKEEDTGARTRLWYEKRMLNEAGSYIIGSPVTGVVTDYREGKRPEVILCPVEEKLYAPAGGKVIRMFPSGNELLFRAEEGTVLRILVGEEVGELQTEYFHPKVIQNEVVNKGKLLLEFDKAALEEEGIECLVSVRVEEVGMADKVSNVAAGRIKVGEEIFEICRM